MCILVVGGDRYLGWPTALHLSAAGHDIGVADDFARRGCDRERCAASLLPIVPLEHRLVGGAEPNVGGTNEERE